VAQKDMLSARERRLRRVALRKGLSLRKLRRGQDRKRPAGGGSGASVECPHMTPKQKFITLTSRHYRLSENPNLGGSQARPPLL
jgi:hypothetical protein